MSFRAAAIFFLLATCVLAQDVKRCAPELLNKPTSRTKFEVKPGEKYRHAPVVSLEIAESGEVQNIKLERSSGVQGADKIALEWTQSMKYNSRPGCGVVSTKVMVTIDF